MKNFIGMIALLIMVALLTACGQGWEKVYVLNWGDYIDPDVIDLLKRNRY